MPLPDLSSRRWMWFVPKDAFVAGAGWRASVVVEGESGHYPTGDWPFEGKPGQKAPYFWGIHYEAAAETARSMNLRLGLTVEDEEQILASSMRVDGRRRPRR